MSQPAFKYGPLEVIHDLNRDHESKHASWSYNSPNHAHPDNHHKTLRFYMNEDVFKTRGIIIPTPAWTSNTTLELVHLTVQAQDGCANVSYALDGLAGICFRDANAEGVMSGKSFVNWKFDVSQYDNLTGLFGIKKCISFLFRETIC